MCLGGCFVIAFSVEKKVALVCFESGQHDAESSMQFLLGLNTYPTAHTLDVALRQTDTRAFDLLR